VCIHRISYRHVVALGYRLKIDYITMLCVIIFETTTEHKSPQQGKLYRPNMHMYNVLKCSRYCV